MDGEETRRSCANSLVGLGCIITPNQKIVVAHIWRRKDIFVYYNTSGAIFAIMACKAVVQETLLLSL